jgi:chemotaxis protein CheX
MSQMLVLDPVLDLNAAAPLQAAFLECRGESLNVDAKEVQRLGGLCLQILLAARRSWSDAGLTLAISGRSAAFDEALALFGAAGRFDDVRSGEGA